MEIAGQYQPTLVALSIIVAIFASYTALDLVRLRANAGWRRWGWLAGAATAMGGGIWAMHFIGMLAFAMPMPVAYDLGLTLASLGLPVLVSGAGLALAGRDGPSWPRLGGGGMLMGLGIVGMHYLGMAAMTMAAVVVYDPALVAVSVLIAVGASTAALWLATTIEATWQRLVSAIVLGLAVVGMHYTAMAAASFIMTEAAAGRHRGLPVLAGDLLGAQVAAVTSFLLLLALASSAIARRSAERQARQAKQRLNQEQLKAAAALREREERYRLAVEATGLGTWDWNLVTGDLLWSERARAILDVSPDVPACYETFLECVHAEDRAAVHDAVEAAIAPAGSGEFVLEFRLSRDGGSPRWAQSTGQVHFEELAQGRRAVRFLGTLLDITERRRHEERLRASLDEKVTLLQEVNHRVKNNLQVIISLIRMENRRVADTQARERLEVLGQRIQVMAQLHDQLYANQDLARIDFGDYLRQLAEGLMALHADRSVRMEIDAEPLACGLETAIPLGLVANELITNSLKHAFPGDRAGVIRVALSRAGDTVAFEVWDDGVGLPKELRSEGLGSQIVRTLARQIDAKMAVEGVSGHRTRLDIPAKHFASGSGTAWPEAAA